MNDAVATLPLDRSGLTNWLRGRPYKFQHSEFELVPMTPDLVDDLYVKWMNDLEVVRYLDSRYQPQNLDTIRAFVGSFDNIDKFIWRIVRRSDNRPVGNCTLFLDHEHSLAEPGIMLGEKDSLGTNIPEETYRCLIDFAFFIIGVSKVYSKTRAVNIPALWIHRKMKMKQEGFLRDHVRFEKTRTGLVYFGLLKEEWERERAGKL